MKKDSNGFRLRISGVVQGVGFRPFVWRIAHELNINGWVLNNAAGVEVAIEADHTCLQQFISRLKDELPPLASITDIQSEPLDISVEGFEIIASQSGDVTTGCAPDAATCSDCRSELFDPENRRYRYPFINCTNCGPRLSIIRQIPYDRASTTMTGFTLCPACEAEYNDPADRRFHAQPNACAECGPQVWLEQSDGQRIDTQEPFELLAKAIRAGQIVAIKGLGGFHLACDATNEAAVAELRQRKYRPAKAFALMAKSIEQIRCYADIDPVSEAMLNSPAAPVVLLTPESEPQASGALSSLIAPGQYQLGFMLPYTPIHWLLMDRLDTPLVMTSGNRSGAPQAISNDDAREQLSGIADLLLMHDRPIHNRVDDSVVRQVEGQTDILRRARGFAPRSIPLPEGFTDVPDLLALGADLKNTLCLIQSGRAVLSQHIGDLEDARTYEQFQHTQALYQNLYQHQPEYLVCDLHPEYFSSKYAQQLADSSGLELLQVQHHHAHLAACLGDNNYPLGAEPVLGVCLDGTGFGTDETLWGCEFLLGDYRQSERVGSLQPFPLIGGNRAIREPWRCLYAQLKQSLPEQSDNQLETLFPLLSGKPLATLDQMVAKQLNAPLSSSAGRLFDAVAAALDCQPETISYEGQAAIELETLAWQESAESEPYGFDIDLQTMKIDPAPFWQQLIDDIETGARTPADMARAFHCGFAEAVAELSGQLQTRHGFSTVALSGGVMQNQLLFLALKEHLQQAGFNVLWHRELPTNDGAIAFGQALIAAAQLVDLSGPEGAIHN